MSKELTAVELILELSNNSKEHGNNMYKLALKHSINMIEIDAELGLVRLKEELAELEKEVTHE